MAVIPVEKVYITFHKSEKEKILETLQDAGILHVSDIGEEVRKEFDVYDKKEQTEQKALEDKVKNLARIIDVLEKYTKPRGFLESLFEKKEEVSKKELLKTVNTINIDEKLEELNALLQDKSFLETRLKNLYVQLEFLRPWAGLNLPLGTFTEGYGRIKFLAGKIKAKYLDEIKDIPFEKVSEDSKFIYIVVAAFWEDLDEIKKKLVEIEFEQVEFHGYKYTPSNELALIEKEIEVLEDERRFIDKFLKEHAENLSIYRMLHDYYVSILQRELVDEKGVETESATFIIGWVEKRNFSKLEEILNNFETATLFKIKPEEGEEVPIFLENEKIAKPFESLVKLYGLPNYREVDPTGIMAPFFAIFFALCLTDAGYGIVLMLLSYYLMKKIKAGYDLFWTLFIGGFFTIFAGAITGGWFGDIQHLWHGFGAFRDKFLLFDPMNEPMKFFAVALGLGYLQIIVGLLVGFYKKVKNSALWDGIFNEISWIGILISLPLGIYLKISLLNYIALGFAVLILLFSAGSKNPIVRVLKGAYNLYGGIGLIGDLLSYVRLMALGIVTAGIAMAVNILTKLVFGIPYLGYILAPLIFVGGHAFSVFVNVMGAFVHSLRLQYVEFFSKFYENGGKPFIPFSWKGKYYKVKTQEE